MKRRRFMKLAAAAPAFASVPLLPRPDNLCAYEVAQMGQKMDAIFFRPIFGHGGRDTVLPVDPDNPSQFVRVVIEDGHPRLEYSRGT